MDIKIFQDYHIGLSATKGYSHQVSLIVPCHAGSKQENNTRKSVIELVNNMKSSSKININ